MASLDDVTGTPVIMVNDITDLQFATPRVVLDVTGLDKAAYERLLGLADFTCTPKGVFNQALSHAALKTVSSSTVVRTWTMTVAGSTLANEVIVTDYEVARAADGALTWQAPMSLASGLVPAWT